MKPDIVVTFWNVRYDGNCKICGNPVDVNDMLPYVVFPYGTSHTVLHHADCYEDYILEYNGCKEEK